MLATALLKLANYGNYDISGEKKHHSGVSRLLTDENWGSLIILLKHNKISNHIGCVHFIELSTINNSKDVTWIISY